MSLQPPADEWGDAPRGPLPNCEDCGHNYYTHKNGEACRAPFCRCEFYLNPL
jgi:hypothetical protein